MSFASYKKSRNSSLEDLVNQAEAANVQQKSFEADPLDWYPTTDKAGNAQILLRLMPPLESEENTFFVRLWKHAFKDDNTQQWYIENCLSTLNPSFDADGVQDPVMQFNQKLIQSAIKRTGKDYKDIDDSDPEKKQAAKQKRNIEFHSNLKVIKDSHKPEANGTLRKWKYGQGMFNEIMKAMKPQKIEGAIEDIEPINPFDLIDGANLLMTITTDPTKKVNGKAQRTYTYKWMKAGPLGTDKEMEAVWEELNSDNDKGKKKFSLREYVSPDKFKSYDALRKRLVKVVGNDPLADSQTVKAPAAPQLAPRPQQSAVTEDIPPWDTGKSLASVEAPKAPDDDWFAKIESKPTSDEE
jgi:hypothetical protein